MQIPRKIVSYANNQGKWLPPARRRSAAPQNETTVYEIEAATWNPLKLSGVRPAINDENDENDNKHLLIQIFIITEE